MSTSVKDSLFQLISKLIEENPDRDGFESELLKISDLTGEDFGKDIDGWVNWYHSLNPQNKHDPLIQRAYQMYKLRQKYKQQ